MTTARVPARCAILAIAGLALLGVTAGPDPAAAVSGRDARREPGQSRSSGAPLLAIVSLSDQRVTFYDGSGKIMQSPISSGATGYETPAGIFTVVQKKEVHSSNLYQDGSMPFMQRITWTGIALHAGVLPGQPASHGCIRMPIAFAQRLFAVTDMGMRVVIVRDDIAPRDIAHPVLFKPDASRREAALAAPQPTGHAPAGVRDTAAPTGQAPTQRYLESLKARAASLSAAAEAAVKRAKDAKQGAARKAADAAAATRSLRAAEGNLVRAEAAVADADRALEKAAATPEKTAQAEQAKAKAIERVEAMRAQLQAAKDQAQPRADAAAQASQELQAAEDAREAALETASAAARKLQPVSVFVSRKAQRLYVRQANEPIYEGPVTIRDADKAIGTFVFTAMGDAEGGADTHWSVVSMYKYSDTGEPVTQPPRRKGEARNAAATTPIPADVTAAKAALDRIGIPPDVVSRFSDVVLPGSSLIVSDEAASIETGKDTDFVVVMSGEPQGALAIRRREPLRDNYDGFFGSPKSKGFFSFWD